jgi:arylsulfatase A-like enzyme
MHHASADWFDGPVGVVRGFAEDLYTRASAGRFTVSSEFFPQVLTWIEAHAAGPAFVYTHLLDAHHRARPRSRKAPAYERYIDNLAIADEQIGELRRTIARLGIEGRTVVIVSSDHGEAFGEHDTIHHQTTLYEELLRVPLIVHAPGAAPRKVEVPVGVIDLGPTILDLFGVATAGHEMGESLVGFLRGQDPAPTRPLAAEGRLKKALLFPDGCKAIVDDRNRTAEVYDLRADPNELVNLVDTDDPTALARVDVLRRFFAVHEHRRPGYEPPYRQ